MNVATILEMAADCYGDRIALGRKVGGIGYGQLRDLAATAARRLRPDVGVVGFVGQSGPAFATAFFASAFLGVPFLPLNYRLDEARLNQLLRGHDGAAVIADPRYAESLRAPGGGAVLRSDDWLADLATNAASDSGRGLAGESDRPALYLYTSGTSAAPKAAVLHHHHLTSYILGSVEFGSADPDEAALVSVPPYHIAGVANLLSNIFSGRRIVYLPNFSPEEWLEVVGAEAITQAMVVPTMLARIVDAVGERQADAPALRLISYGGARMHESVLRRALPAFPNTDFVNAYGLTETSSSIAVLGPEDHRAALASSDPAVVRRLSSVGRPLPGIEVQIRDVDGRPCAAGAIGDVWVRGEQVSGEYAGSGSVCDADSWFPTRDAGWIDDGGYLFIEGRTDDTIIRGGENIAPAEVEDVLLRHPHVADAAVVGVPDREWGQRVAAAVILRHGAEVEPAELIAWTRRHLRGSRAAEIVVIRDELPRTDTGKLLRRKVLDDLRQVGHGAGA